MLTSTLRVLEPNEPQSQKDLITINHLTKLSISILIVGLIKLKKKVI